MNRYAFSWEGGILISAGAWAAIGGEVDTRGKMVHLNNAAVAPIQDLEVVNAVCLTPNGRWTGAAGSGKIHVLDHETGKATVLTMDV